MHNFQCKFQTVYQSHKEMWQAIQKNSHPHSSDSDSVDVAAITKCLSTCLKIQ